MKIMHFAPYFPPERVGGVGEFVARLHEALLAAGHESLVVTRGRASSATVRRIARTKLGWFLGTALWASRAARCDVVHCQSGEALPVMLGLALRRRRAPILVTFHVGYREVAASLAPYTLAGRRFAGGLAARLVSTAVACAHRTVDRCAAALADDVAAVSASSARDALGARHAARAHVIHSGLPPLRAPRGSAPHVELLYVGTSGHRKRVNALPYVLAQVRREIPGARLRIVGFTLAKTPELAALFAEQGLIKAVEALGVLPSSEIPAHYASADVLVVPSAYEGLPLVLLEAMQCGLAVVATRVSGNPEAIEDGRNGFLVELDEPTAMARRCVELLRDPELRGRLAAAARATVAERFDMQRQLRAYLDLYESLAAARRALSIPTS